ncbi:MAG: hypothetical protein WKF75_11740 [Singulisphaera sp.]
MFAGPIIAREVLTAPRPLRFYVARASYVGLLFILMWTAWQVLIGWREIREFGIIARFGGVLFQFFVLIQLTLMLFFAPLAAATAVAHEKDRRTFMLLLMTDLSDLEIVLGKMVASLLNILASLAAGAGLLSLCAALRRHLVRSGRDPAGRDGLVRGGRGAMGLLVALWRDRSFQAISLTILMVVFSVAGVEAFARAFPTVTALGVPLAEVLNPYRAMFAVIYPARKSWPASWGRQSRLHPRPVDGRGTPGRLRDGDAPRLEPRPQRAPEQREGRPGRAGRDPRRGRGSGRRGPRRGGFGRLERLGRRPGKGRESARPASRPPSARVPARSSGEPGPTTGLHVPRRTHRRITRTAGAYRRPWANPILWREMKTRAYGTKPLIIKGAYVLIFAIGVALFNNMATGVGSPLSTLLTMIPVSLGSSA